VAARDGLAGLDMLAGGEGAAADAVNEDFDARSVMGRTQPHMIGRAFVAERGGDGLVDREGRVGEGEAELRQRFGPFMAAVRHGDEIGGAEMAAVVGGVGRGGDGGSIGGPHRRCAERLRLEVG
jgi:hypothetical protein